MSDLKVDLTGKVAVVTGGGNGIGRACGIAFAQSGAAVALADLSEEALTSAKQEIEALGGQCITYVCDVTNKKQIDDMMDHIYDTQGHIDILLNSAGINIQQVAHEVTEEAWDKIMNVNVKGTFFCCQAAGKKMMEQRYGKIINVGSAMSVVGYVKRAAYCASKGAVAQFSKVLAGEWAPYNITVNTVAPTFINTPFTEPMFKDAEFKADVESRILLNRIGEVRDVTGTVLYLASSAADFVTGSMVMVDGGWTAW
ncbi:Short-chain dehydrogenase/reductase SDR [Syntrophomonas zehnderi OL-4]|uniref:Short-chain dehydrogenase/reductase SDR n=1 Tax=Syntrophomonas zehnderi OL-4 TaxID=690567 RepID=A0A0E3W3S9_9FIRM|nr:glucose 1-dehydrogenase [Syntrophomonas zehnderi]CFY02808.1 Short-chain dehydrogenase/reductase SDR [Syntrophomonas zehnderi OL-4]